MMIDNSPRLKKCSHCGLQLPAMPRYFYRSKGGLRAECKACFKTKSMTIRANRTARSYGNGQRLKHLDILAAMERQAISDSKWRDYWTGESLSLDELVLDHIHALSLGGHNLADNICLTSRKANAIKAGKPLNLWLAQLAAMGIDHALNQGQFAVQKRLL